MTLDTRPLLALLLVLWSCDKPRPDAAPQDNPTRATTTPTDSTVRELAPWLALMATGVDTTTTLEVWLTAHPADRLTDRRPAGMTDNTFCRSAVDSVPSGGRRWVRSAVFVIPLAPPGETLPFAPCARCGSSCRHPIRRPVSLATEALRRHFWKALGSAPAVIALSGPGTGNWSSGSSWVAGRRVVVVALAPAERYPDETTGETVSLPETAVAVSYVIGRDMDVATGDRVDQGEYP